MDFRNWDPGNRWGSGDYDWYGEIPSLGIKGFRKIWEEDQPNLEEDFIGKEKIGYSGYWAMTRDSDRIWFRDIRLRESESNERDGIAKWRSISTLFMTRSYEFPGTGSELQGERPIRSFVIKSLALLEIMWSTLFWLWGHECLLVLCRTAYGLGCRLGLSRLHTWKQALWVVSSNQTQRVVESMETVQKSDSRLHSVDAKTLTWDLEAFHVTTMISMGDFGLEITCAHCNR
ncbi:hypothetical protein Bca52824_054085 [Brassica carinata]|uniref:Uncharacterized protein n=1 Tax=Brassica carinata TaxID=52824 RepID=A0A8X7R985_BRACI|nr:hypothetical protein Bca52824_054085 [Brassica carinata]